ncbi:MAG TPA: ribonuclease P protein component [Pseudomonadales bacterium]|nr:ribonuclease P protein component [Pseudomonadales bacterium]
MQATDLPACSVGARITPASAQAQRGLPATGFDLRFGKQHRLLTPKEFKAVFDGAVFKASHRSLLLLAIPCVTADASPARLGLVVAKKHARLAVQRNRLKRLLRETFRHHKTELAGLDIVALVKPGLWQMENAAIRAVIEEQWRRLLKQKQRSAP